MAALEGGGRRVRQGGGEGMGTKDLFHVYLPNAARAEFKFVKERDSRSKKLSMLNMSVLGVWWWRKEGGGGDKGNGSEI